MIVFCSPEELLVDEVLKTLVVSPNHPNRKKFKVTVVRNAVSLFSSFSTNVNTCSNTFQNVLDQRAQEWATNLQNSFEDYVLSDESYLNAAKTGNVRDSIECF